MPKMLDKATTATHGLIHWSFRTFHFLLMQDDLLVDPERAAHQVALLPCKTHHHDHLYSTHCRDTPIQFSPF